MVRLFVGQIMVEERRCFVPEGVWRADWYGTFVASFDTASACPESPANRPEESLSGPDWARRAVGFRIENDTGVLLGGAGEVVGRLIAEEVAPPEHLALAVEIMRTEFGSPDDQERAEWAAAAPLPSGLTAVTGESLVGRWVPESWVRASVEQVPGGTREVNRADTPFDASPGFEVAASGEWTGSDGCNRDAGRWRVGPDGSLVASQFSAHTLIGCDGVDVGTWLFSARRAALDGTTLVLLRASGEEIGRLTRPAA